MKYTLIAMIVLPAYLLASCDATEVVAPPVEEEPGLLAFAAQFSPGDDPRLVLAPFDDPHAFRVVPDLFVVDPRFSPDKSMLLFPGHRGDYLYEALLYSVARDTATILISVEEPERRLGLQTETVVWDAAGAGFYFDLRDGIADVFETYYYALGDRSIVRFNEQISPVERIGRDTLIVRGRIERRVVFFLFDPRSGGLTPLNNPHLDIEARYVLYRDLDWNEKRRLLAFVEEEEGSRQTRIAITNLDGSFYQELTSGEYADHRPRWGPGNVVVFTRAEATFPPRAPATLMTVDVETSEVQPFLSLEDLGAMDLYYLDY